MDSKLVRGLLAVTLVMLLIACIVTWVDIGRYGELPGGTVARRPAPTPAAAAPAQPAAEEPAVEGKTP